MKAAGRKSLSVPLRNPIAKGTLRTLIKDADSTVEEFVEVL